MSGSGQDRSEVGTSDRSRKEFANALSPDEYRDDRKQWEWQSKYPSEARKGINIESGILLAALFIIVALSAFFLSLSGQEIDFAIGGTTATINLKYFAIYCLGTLGGVTFAIKWLVHAAATGRWHLDRRYWRLMVPWIGGVYACVILAFMDSGLIGGPSEKARSMAAAASLAFLVGYFSDGVSGLLSNVAHAVFGTLEKK